MENRELKIATAPTRTSTRWTNTLTTPQDLTALAYDPIIVDHTADDYKAMSKPQRDQAKDVGGYVAGHLKNGHRRKGHVLARSVITLDIDYLPTDVNLQDELTNRLDCAWLVHTTLSHTADTPRWRLWVWLTTDITADEYGAIGRRLAQDLNPGLTWFDPTTFEPERFMYKPSKLTDGDYEAHVSHGKPVLNPADVLSRYDTWTDVTTWPGITADTAPRMNSHGTKVEDPRAKPGMIGAFNRAWPIDKAIIRFLPEVYKPGTVKGRYTYTAGTSTNGLIVYNSGNLCYSQHATDPAADGHTHSSFDLIRIHQYGNLDADASATTPANKLPSYLAMLDMVTEDPEARKANAAEMGRTILEVFDKIPDDDTDGTVATIIDQDEQSETPPTEKEMINKIRASLAVKRSGEPIANIGNFELIFLHDPHLTNLAWNQLTRQIEAQDPQAIPWKKDHPQWTDNDEAQLKVYIARTYSQLYHATIMRDVLLATASTRAFHPVRDYLNHLPPWDGIPRIDTLLVDVLGAPDTPYVHAVTRKTFVAAVRRTWRPGTKFDHVLTLVGPQGIGKSTIFARLGGQWFSDSLSISDMKNGKDAAEKLDGNLIVEVSELAGIRKVDTETIKAFVSRNDDKYRAAYARAVESHPRQSIIVATTNAIEGFLRDPSGNRRWWAVPVTGGGRIKAHDLDDATVDQIWAEAKHYEAAGEKLFLTGEVAEAALEAQTAAAETDERTGLVAEYLSKKIPTNWDHIPLDARRSFLDNGSLPSVGDRGGFGEPMQLMERDAVSKIEIWAECFRRDPEAMKRSDSYDIAAIMQQIDGWGDSGRSQRLPIYGKQRIYERMC